MTERSKWELGSGIVLVVLGILNGGIQLLSLAMVGEPTEYFEGWWLVALCIVFGSFVLLRYRFDRVHRLSRAVGESPYFKGAWTLVCLAIGGLGVWLAVLAGDDLGSEGARGVLVLGSFLAIVGLAAAVKTVRNLRHI